MEIGAIFQLLLMEARWSNPKTKPDFFDRQLRETHCDVIVGRSVDTGLLTI